MLMQSFQIIEDLIAENDRLRKENDEMKKINERPKKELNNHLLPMTM